MKKILNFLFTPYTVLAIGVLAFIMFAIPNDITLYIGVVLAIVVTLIVITLCVFAWVVNPIKNYLNKEDL